MRPPRSHRRDPQVIQAEGEFHQLLPHAKASLIGTPCRLRAAFDLWQRSPIIGLGIDNPEIASSGAELAGPLPGQGDIVPIIFDNQYLHTLVTLGLVGLIGVVWLVWGSTARFVRASKQIVGHHGDFVAACAVACAGYGAGMLFFDSLAYVQVTLMLFIAAALGLKTLTLADARAPTTEPQTPTI
jgi:O-antigen ligase